jgi:hypothetical protein
MVAKINYRAQLFYYNKPKTKKMKKLSSLLVLVVLVFATSCTLQDLDRAAQRLNQRIVENPENAEEEAGRIHNDALAYIDLQMSTRYADQKLSRELLVAILLEYQKDQAGALEEKILRTLVRQYYAILSAGQTINPSTIDICEIVPVICNPGPPPYNPALPTFENPVMTEDVVRNFANATKQIDAIKAYENEILADPTLEGEQRKAYMSYLATYRHSTQYWYNSTNLDERQHVEQDQLTRACNTCDIIAADAAGAYLGSWFGPWGAGIGGAAASAAAAYEIYGQ